VSKPTTSEWLDRTELAELTGFTRRSIENWDQTGQGPRRYRLGNRIRYRRDDVEKWIASREVTQEAAAR
jgi:predicted DNA-binding transcriptional regulator AlpA